MVSIRNIHFNVNNEFFLKKWINSLSLKNKKSKKKLIYTWNYCYDISLKQNIRCLLLFRGIEMIEILSILNMDINSLQAAILLPFLEKK